ncbi:unnamed protein product [Adineta steineri]|uniref:Uncharacterized protein n=1 Tax=Adineta steineri TaxID=433720 RepID=A0A819U6E2_9BILA|nr:unnamed protein product [Adineta steineri]
MPGDTKNICHPCILWIKLILSASIPLLITVFTVVTYIQQKDISERNRQQDLQIANLTREEDQRLANELHYQNIFQNYIDDVTNILYKDHPNEAMFITEEKRFFYIGRKTIITSRQLNSDYRKQLLSFLIVTQLVPNSKKSNITNSLNGVDFSNVHYSCFPAGEFEDLEINENIRIENINLTGSNLNIDHGENISLSQVVLPNGTWMINSSNLVEDGDGEINCLSSNKPYSVWENSFAGSGEIILALNNETTSDVTSFFNLGKCHFTSGQPHGEAQFNVSAYFGGRNECENGSIQIDAGLDEDFSPTHLLSNPCI